MLGIMKYAQFLSWAVLTAKQIVFQDTLVLPNCTADAFASALPSDVEVLLVDVVPKGSSYGEGERDIAYPKIPTDLPELCAVTVRVNSSASSSYRFALLLPTEWNERYLLVGNGGYAGGIDWMNAAVGTRYGFASASTDTGHNSTMTDGSWALKRPESRTDWGWRAIHGTALLSKKLIAAYYGQAAHHAYYSGCSTGGRQGLREVQLYPDTFDGLLVAAPAWWTAHLQPWSTWVAAQNLPVDSDAHISMPLFSVIGAEIERQCDGADGMVDGIVSAPQLCAFDYSALLCPTSTANTSSCLSEAQIATLQKIYGRYEIDGRLAMPGFSMGSEWQFEVLFGGSEPNGLASGYQQYFLLEDASWSWEQYNDSIVAIADERDPGSATAYGFGDMSAARDRGTKIVMYHGMADGYIPAGSSEYFYNQVVASVGLNANGEDGLKAMQEWFRYFFVPGMGHCGYTNVDAPWYIAGANQASGIHTSTSTSLHSVPGFEDAEHDVLLALMDWVEKGRALDSIVATTWIDSMDPSSGVLRQRPLCPYPGIAEWDRVGNVNQSSSWVCTQ